MFSEAKAKRVGPRIDLLLHETTHSFLFLTQQSESTQRLLQLVTDVRGATEGVKGLTALGSLDFYKGDKKIVEDTTELMTMYAWDPDYAEEFTDFLAQPEARLVRNRVGLVSVSNSAPIFEILSAAVEQNIAAA